mmetsp:Transcript_1031/g.1658  ORF Transcript_1031/g.1658 Transcript_1031/m.1658 type:complete len:212 (-) Transcript_1031:324-959(-)
MPSQCSASKRHDINPFHQIIQTFQVPLPLGGMAQHPVRPPDSLCWLEVSVPRHQQVHFRLGPVSCCFEEFNQQRTDHHALLFEPQSNVCRHLVVARSSCVQFPCDAADYFPESSFVGSVNVLITVFDLENTRLPFLGHFAQPINHGFALLTCDDPSFTESTGIRATAFNVNLPKSLVEGERLVESLHQWVGRTSESASPELLGCRFAAKPP